MTAIMPHPDEAVIATHTPSTALPSTCSWCGHITAPLEDTNHECGPPPPRAETYTLDGRVTMNVAWGERRVSLHRSPTGRSFRIFVDGKEWTP